mmetsp:Transcript_29731/g.39536  ORF Transcript_29731/g.39536 Transcript_29731/m.39536 type:complete len:233 (+) Transcript_29731:4534-5232(+)
MKTTGELVKLKIQGFTDTTFSESIPDALYETYVNPEKYSIGKKVEYYHQEAPGTSAESPKFGRIISPDITIPLLFDRTGVISNPRKNFSGINSIKEEIERLEEVVYKFDGKEHKPRHVQIIWGDLDFKGVLTDLNYEYKIFDSDGKPIRVTASAKFVYAVDENLRAAKEKKNSPDLTHIRQVKEGDTLPNMCNNIYGNPKYYLEVAKTNGITNFRKLSPGQRINFPPIEKLS